MAALEVVARSKRLKKLNLEALGNADIFTYVLCENCQNLQHLGKVSPPKSPAPLLVHCKLFVSQRKRCNFSAATAFFQTHLMKLLSCCDPI